ncbi:MAG: hypothetical protein SF097_22760 [Acidobacteriota bacterium]|nr:hypothetical protein [Acidobacteriota bacterium]
MLLSITREISPAIADCELTPLALVTALLAGASKHTQFTDNTP